MESVPGGPSLEQQNYWQEFVQLKADTLYVRRYRDRMRGWATATAAIRAVASSASIGAWVIWKQYAFVWASLIAIAQVADALKTVFPVYKRKKALTQWLHALNRLFIEAQRDWDGISAGLCTDAQIRALVHKLRLKKSSSERKFAPDGLKQDRTLSALAEREAIHFFQARYGLLLGKGDANEPVSGIQP